VARQEGTGHHIAPAMLAMHLFRTIGLVSAGRLMEKRVRSNPWCQRFNQTGACAAESSLRQHQRLALRRRMVILRESYSWLILNAVLDVLCGPGSTHQDNLGAGVSI